jgi:photosystem II stability/assembly factor-like uncharacterized protein
LYAGGSDGNWSGSGLWKSTDSGLSWFSLSSSFGYRDVDIIAIAPGALLVGSGDLFKSTDGGQSWASASSGLPKDSWIPVLVVDRESGTLYAGVYDSLESRDDVYRSTDSGVSWSPLGSGLFGHVSSLKIDSVNSRKLYAGTSGGLFAFTLDAERQEQ